MHIRPVGVQVRHVAVAQAFGGGETVFIVAEFQNCYTGVGVVEAGPHQVDRNVQQSGQPCANSDENIMMRSFS